MKLPTQKRILREDIKDAPDWVSSLINPINSFMEVVYQSLNKNITFSENVAAFIKELTYTTSSTYPAGLVVSFANSLKTKASGVMLMQIYETATYTPPPGPVYIPWVENNGAIMVSSITGLEASKTYLIRLLVS